MSCACAGEVSGGLLQLHVPPSSGEVSNGGLLAVETRLSGGEASLVAAGRCLREVRSVRKLVRGSKSRSSSSQ